MPIQAIDARPAAASLTPNSETGSKELGQDEFLKLLMTQLGNQDPLNPMDSAGFMDQITALNTVDQLIQSKALLGEMVMGFNSLNNQSAVNLVGKSVLGQGDTVSVNNGAPVDLHFDLEGEAAEVVITVQDADGTIVDTITLSNRAAGQDSFSWAPRAKGSGQNLPDGDYSFHVSATDAAGDAVGSTTYIEGVVEELRFVDGVPYLVVGSQELTLGQILRVRDIA